MKTSSETRRKLLLAGLGSLGAQLALGDANAQDAAKVMPRAYRVAFENDKLRVLDFAGRPGMGICGEGMHSHPAHLTVVLADWQGRRRRRMGRCVTARASSATSSGARPKPTKSKTPEKAIHAC